MPLPVTYDSEAELPLPKLGFLALDDDIGPEVQALPVHFMLRFLWKDGRVSTLKAYVQGLELFKVHPKLLESGEYELKCEMSHDAMDDFDGAQAFSVLDSAESVNQES